MKVKACHFLFAVIVTGCSVPDYTSETKTSLADKAYSYAKKHPLEFTQSETGLLYSIKNPEKGSHPTVQDTVKVHYKGMLTKQSVFEETMGGPPVEVVIKDAIEGWQEAIPMLKKKGRGTFIIPPYLAYGDKRVGKIPNDAILVFEIYLVDF